MVIVPIPTPTPPYPYLVGSRSQAATSVSLFFRVDWEGQSHKTVSTNRNIKKTKESWSRIEPSAHHPNAIHAGSKRLIERRKLTQHQPSFRYIYIYIYTTVLQLFLLWFGVVRVVFVLAVLVVCCLHFNKITHAVSPLIRSSSSSSSSASSSSLLVAFE